MTVRTTKSRAIARFRVERQRMAIDCAEARAAAVAEIAEEVTAAVVAAQEEMAEIRADRAAAGAALRDRLRGWADDRAASRTERLEQAQADRIALRETVGAIVTADFR